MAILYYIIEAINPKGKEFQTKASSEEQANKNKKFLEDHGYTCIFVTPVTEEIYGINKEKKEK
jgi:hypothetical protein